MPEFVEKRPFSRIDFHAPAIIRQGDRQWSSEVLDISLKGALLALPDSVELEEGRPVELEIRLNEQIEIDMQCRIAHRENHHLGLACQTIDLESIQHLRRLMELNLGDASAMERELSELISPGLKR